MTTFTGRRGAVVALRNSDQPEAARVVVSVPLRIDGGRPIAVRCHYHPSDVTADPPGEDCPDDCPDSCPTHSH